jgi:hypothetical protein
MSNRIEAGEAKAQSNRHRETTATAPVLDSTRHTVSSSEQQPIGESAFFEMSRSPLVGSFTR